MEVWNAMECWFLPRLVSGIRSSVRILALPLRLYILRTATGFWKYCKKKGGGGGFLALKSHIICSFKQSCMKTKADIVCFSLNSVFLIDPENDDCVEEKDAQWLFVSCDFVPNFSLLFFSFSPLSLFLSSPLYHAPFAPSHLGYAHLI